MINIIGKRFRFLALSGIIIAACIIALSVSGLSMGIDFSSGSILNLSFEQEVPLETLKQTLAEFGHEKAIVQVTGEGDFLIRLQALNGEEKSLLEEGLAERFGQYDELGFENVEPVIARQTANNAMIAMAVASVGVLLYITFAFRRMPKPLRYGTCAI
jgi:preprotein translocase subunit SecF